ncbi:BnaUnng00210D [Brassica napus]|uniref:BnaUnng00210D protein n=1 Tax=Brassica napus TaxID=3708 RepID=A0A078GQM1_BRANA|nr:BnaUnng00210D [Brassica napus]
MKFFALQKEIFQTSNLKFTIGRTISDLVGLSVYSWIKYAPTPFLEPYTEANTMGSNMLLVRLESLMTLDF